MFPPRPWGRSKSPGTSPCPANMPPKGIEGAAATRVALGIPPCLPCRSSTRWRWLEVRDGGGWRCWRACIMCIILSTVSCSCTKQPSTRLHPLHARPSSPGAVLQVPCSAHEFMLCVSCSPSACAVPGAAATDVASGCGGSARDCDTKAAQMHACING